VNTNRTLRFVILEDDDLDAQLVQEHVRDAGFTVSWARVRNESEFRAALLERNADLIISDFLLPGYGGLGALELAHALAPGIPFLFVSGAIGEERATETLRRGATDYVLKDRMQRLALAIERALELASERRRRERAEAERDRLLASERHARELAETANRLKDDFLATASHELRTPLNAILGWAKLLRSGESNPDLLSRGLATIERNAIVQARLIEDILDISRIVTGKVQLRPAPTSVSAFVHAAVDALRPAATAKQIELSLDAERAGEIEGDAERLQQVVWNLVSNAVKFTPSGGQVKISAQRTPQRLTLSVRDSGQGLDPSAVSRVFERFWQADSSSTRRHGGLGLGLSIVRYLVELHGGTVRAESDGIGLGACFTIDLPTAPPSTGPGSRPPPPDREPVSPAVEAQGLAGLRVLIVEDDEDSREIVALIVQQQGAQVSAADSADSALSLLRVDTPDIIISDIGMPDTDGYAFLKTVRALPAAHGGNVPAIALTAFAREVDRADAAAAGFQAHVAKPVLPGALIQAIRLALGRP